MAASEGFARTFLDLGEPMRRLFAELRENGRDTTAGYVGRLMAAFPS
jgi:hypothetical protein